MAHPRSLLSRRHSDLSFHQYVINDDPNSMFTPRECTGVKSSELDHSWSEDAGSVSSDSGYYTSFNMSANTSFPGIEENSDHVGELRVRRVSASQNLKPLLDSTNQQSLRPQHQTLVKIERSDHQVGFAKRYATVNQKSCGLYRPVNIQPKPAGMKHQTINTQTVATVLPQIKPRSATRCRKSQLIPRVDDVQMENVKPSQELLAARRLLEEALITGNIVSQARYARLNQRFDKVRLERAQRSTVRESFSKKPAQPPPAKRPRLDDTSNCPRALYQENKRFEGRKFSWKIGIHGPHKSFNKLSIKRKNKRSHWNKRGVVNSSEESDYDHL